MIILPDRNICRTKVLMPVPRRDWMPPSYAQPKTVFGHENRTLFRLRSRLSDGHITWHGYFEDRDDADAFLYAIVTGNLVNQPDIWRLPTPMWHPDFGVDVTFEFAVTVTLTTTGTANTWIVPADWTSANNRIHCIGGGASGAVARAGTLAPRYAAGGGAGGYGSNQNLSLTSGASITYGVGVGGAFQRLTANGTLSGSAGGDTYFNAASYAAAAFGGVGGLGGSANVSNANANGGAGGAGKGTFSATGGNGGNITAAGFYSKATGGGGAAGPNGNGVNGVNTATAAHGGTDGGAGDNSLGGAGGLAGQNNGSAGTEISNGVGSGGGGGGNGIQTGSATAGDGGAYGAGGGAATGTGTITSGAGRQGVIILVYNPQLFSFNLAMMGM